MKKLLTVIVLMLLIAVGVIAGSPYYVAYQMGQAYEARDGDALARHIDFEQVRPSIKNQLTTRFRLRFIFCHRPAWGDPFEP